MTPAKMNKVESAMRAALAFRDAFNQQNIDQIMNLFVEHCIIETYHPAPDGIMINGKDAFANYLERLFHSHPKIHIEIEEVFGFGERCIMRWKLHWINNDGVELHLRGVDVYKTQNDLICEKYAYGKFGEIV